MKNQTIRNAYDSINPTEAQEEKLRQKLLEHCPVEGQKGKRYASQLYKPSPWGTLSAAAACLLVVLLGAAVLGKMTEPVPELSRVTEPAETTIPVSQETEPLTVITEPIIVATEPTEAPVTVEPTEPDPNSPFGPGSYLDYVNWIRNRDNTQEPYRTRANTAWYTYYDLNDDGIRDLLIGSEDGFIAEAITCIDGQLSLLFGVGCNFRVCENGAILTVREDTQYVIYRMSGTEHSITSTIWYDGEAEQWYRYVSLIDRQEAITQANAKEILEHYVFVELTMRELSCFQVE